MLNANKHVNGYHVQFSVITYSIFNSIFFFFFLTAFTTNCQYLKLIVIRTILLNLILLNYNETVRIKMLSIMPFIITYSYIFVYNIAINPVK